MRKPSIFGGFSINDYRKVIIFMKISEKINLDFNGLNEYGPINIVAFGDSVTHGMLGEGEIDYETVYWNRLRKKILNKRAYVPINVIDAGIGGETTRGSLHRIESQVLVHKPDLVIVCFGLNDTNDTIADFVGALEIIFDRCKNSSDVIYMTPNMMNTYVSEDTAYKNMETAAKTAEVQNNGTMDLYMEKACECAERCGVRVCDCYSKWKELSKKCDTTKLLVNRINHPTREMHELFAQSLFDMIFDDEPGI